MLIKAFIMCSLIMRSPSNLHLLPYTYKILPPFYSQYATVGSSAWAPLHVYWDFWFKYYLCCRAKIDDPEDSKPEDWDKPEHIPDPDATKPEDWDDDMDGEWEPPMIDNPEYKGEWKPRQIDNPAYKGPWIHPEIDNPEYNADDAKDLGKYDFCKVGLDLWQVKSGTIFDNFLISDDPAEAKKAGEDLWAVTKDAEKKMKDEQDEEERKKAEEEAKADEEEEDDEDKDDEEPKDEDEEDSEETTEHDEL